MVVQESTKKSVIGGLVTSLSGLFSKREHSQRTGGSSKRAPERRVGDFTMLRVVGKGSFAKVILVRQKDSHQLFAMKVLSNPKLSSGSRSRTQRLSAKF